MTIQEALGVYLSGYPGLVALIGADGIYAVQARQDTRSPYVTYRFEGRVDVQTLDNPPGKAGQARILISAFDESYDVANQVAEQLRQALSGFQGQMGGNAGVEVKHCLLEEMRDEDVAEYRLFEVLSTYDIMFAVPDTAPQPS